MRPSRYSVGAHRAFREVASVAGHTAGPDALAAELAAALGGPFAADEPLREALLRPTDPTELAALCRAGLLRQAVRVADERAYALTRLLYERLTGGEQTDGLAPCLGRVEVSDRTRLIRERAPEHPTAAVAVPLVRLPGVGLALAVTRRSSTNGYTGGPMSNAGEVVLFGGAREPGEPMALTAVRELVEEAGVKGPEGEGADADLRFDPFEEISEWTTESGFEVKGFLVNAPHELPRLLSPDAREVEDVGFISLETLYATDLRTVYHPVCGIDRHRKPLFVGEFASPTCEVADVDGERRWQLWGLAGHMVQVLRERYPAPADLGAASDRRRATRARRAPVTAAPLGHALVVAAHRTRRLMSGPLGVPRARLVAGEVLSEVLGEPSLLLLDCDLPRGNSTKVRAVSGLLFGALEAASERCPSDDVPQPALLTLCDVFRGATLVAASTGSHARAVALLARWLNEQTGESTTPVTAEVFLSPDIPARKLRLLEDFGVRTVLCGDFNDATRAARQRTAELTALGRPAVFLPSDPEPGGNPAFGITGMDSAAGLATLLLDLDEHLRGGTGPARVDEVRIPTSGGATYAACAALAAGLRAAGSPSQVGAVTAAFDAASPTLLEAIAAGTPGHVTGVDWPRAINGLAQPEVAPGAWELLSGAGALDASLLHPVTRDTADLAVLVIQADTGTRPEPAGAASVGSQLLARLMSDPGFAERVGRTLAARLPADAAAESVALLARAVRENAGAGARRPERGTRVYVVSGASV